MARLQRWVYSAVVFAAVVAPVAMVPSAAQASGGGGGGGSVQYTYTKLSSESYTCSGEVLAEITNYTGTAGTYTVGQQIGSTYSFAGKAGFSVGSATKLAAEVGFTYSTTKTYTASGTHTLQHRQYLSLRKGYYRTYVRQNKYITNLATGVSTLESSTAGYVYRPQGVCTVIGTR